MPAAEKVRRWNQGTRIRDGSLDNAAQVIPAGGDDGRVMLFQQAQAGANDLGLIVERHAGDKPVNQGNANPAGVAGPGLASGSLQVSKQCC